jgi:maltose alpha-D-glucosyltransferase/alpha-amylase
MAIMLRCFLIQKAVHELGHALNSRMEGVDQHLRALEMTLREYRCL